MKLTIVYDASGGDWGGLYNEAGHLIEYGHECTLHERALRIAGIEERRVAREVIMANWPADNRTVRATLAEIDAAQRPVDALRSIADVYAGKVQ